MSSLANSSGFLGRALLLYEAKWWPSSRLHTQSIRGGVVSKLGGPWAGQQAAVGSPRELGPPPVVQEAHQVHPAAHPSLWSPLHAVRRVSHRHLLQVPDTLRTVHRILPGA